MVIIVAESKLAKVIQRIIRHFFCSVSLIKRNFCNERKRERERGGGGGG